MGGGLVAAGHGDEGVEDRGLDEDRVHRVAAHVPVLFGRLEGHGLGIHPHCRLGGVIGPHAGGCGEAGHGRDVYDRGRGGGTQVRHRVFAAQHHAVDIDRLDPVPVVQRIVFSIAQFAADAGVVDQDRQPAHRGDGGFDHGDPVGLAGHVMGKGEGRVRHLGIDGRGQGLDPVQIDVGQGHPGPLARQHPGHGHAQSTGRPGDQRALAGDPPSSCRAHLTALPGGRRSRQ